MKTNKRELQHTSLDFDVIKQNLISYFKEDSTFQDYNFEGSALNLLTDILAYTSHMMALTANMSINEMFLDSAQLKQSVVSKAKELGYTPRSYRTPVAMIDLIFNCADGRNHVNIPTGTRFSTSNSGINSIFCTAEPYIAKPTGIENQYMVENVKIYEGNYTEFTYDVDNTNVNQRFIVPSLKADISTLRVYVQSGMSIVQYVQCDSILNINSDSRVYFIHQNPDGMFEVTFGDGVLGKEILSGSSIILSYVITNKGNEMNGCNSFSKAQMIDGISDYTIRCVSMASGGAEQESIEEIRRNAMQQWKSQNRAVTESDYEVFLLHQYPWIDSMVVWGGERNNPPVYGKVFLCIKPKAGNILSDSMKETIKQDLIKKHNVLTVEPVIVDPEYLYIGVKTRVVFDSHNSTYQKVDIQKAVRNAIINHFKNKVEDFNKNCWYSPLVRAIDTSNKFIISSNTSLWLEKRIYPKTFMSEDFLFSFNNRIKPKTLVSSHFDTDKTSQIPNKILKDDGTGKIHLYDAVNQSVIIDSDVGKVNYVTGEVNIVINPTLIPSSEDIRFYAEPVEDDIFQTTNNIILLDTSGYVKLWNQKAGLSISVIPSSDIESE